MPQPMLSTFQPTLPARGATPPDDGWTRNQPISTHAPRTGSDRYGRRSWGRAGYFNPRSPHGERRSAAVKPNSYAAFQPTLPARGATRHQPRNDRSAQGFQPTLPARGATPRLHCSARVHRFQPTLPARGATRKNPRLPKRLPRFQPTLPARGATVYTHSGETVIVISTHAPRTGSDGTRTDAHAPPCISTHAPRTGSDDCQVVRHFFLKVFQPTLPARGATPQPSCPRTWQGHFNPRSPHGERRFRCFTKIFDELFQPTLPARGATWR